MYIVPHSQEVLKILYIFGKYNFRMDSLFPCQDKPAGHLEKRGGAALPAIWKIGKNIV